MKRRKSNCLKRTSMVYRDRQETKRIDRDESRIEDGFY